jgi:hypothetical protein
LISAGESDAVNDTANTKLLDNLHMDIIQNFELLFVEFANKSLTGNI